MNPKQLGPYRIEKLIGRGGMGAVYEAVDLGTGERVAVKALVAAMANDESFRIRFGGEVEALKKLRHPNIVRLLGYGEEEGLLFYSMQLIKGFNLEQALQSGRQFHWREVVKIGVDVCGALKHAHDRGIIHRDIKPANLMIDEDEQVMLSDFGIAKLFGGGGLTIDGGIIGTADYMAPEQGAGEPVSPRSDLYSLGSVLYALLAHRPPFVGKSLPEVIHMLRFDDPLPVSRFAFGVPMELEEIIARLLEKEPARRMPTALALANRLKPLLLTPGEELVSSDHTQIGDDEHDFVLNDDPVATVNGALSSVDAMATAAAPPTSEAKIEEPPSTDVTTDSSLPQEPAPLAGTAELAPRPKTMPDGKTIQTGEIGLQAEDSNPAPSRFFPVEEEELGRLDETPDDEMPPWAKWLAVMSAVLGIGLFLWFVTRPPSPDQLYDQIQAAADDGELDEVAYQIERFLAVHGDDPRTDEVAEYQNDLEIERLQKRLEFRARRLHLSERLSLVELTYLDAIQDASINPDLALKKLQALVAAFADQEDSSRSTQQCVELARRQADRLQTVVARRQSDGAELLARRLRRAEEIAATDPQAACDIWRGVIALYSHKPWAADAVRRAARGLNKNSNTESSPTP